MLRLNLGEWEEATRLLFRDDIYLLFLLYNMLFNPVLKSPYIPKVTQSHQHEAFPVIPNSIFMRKAVLSSHNLSSNCTSS